MTAPGKDLYPPTRNVDYPTYNTASSTTTLQSLTSTKIDHNERAREISRTPSPTPSELKELKTGAIDWKAFAKPSFWIRKDWILYYIIIVVLVTITALITIYHKQIVDWMTPIAVWLRDEIKFGWLVPIGVLFVISFPPLFGHEIVAILCGLVWGLWIGFAIVAAGTFLGEVGNFYAFKYCCRARGEKLERTKISYACLAQVVRDGGFKIALVARLSAIPGHFTTAVFSTCGMNIFVFSIAAILSMPKQLITVYLGVILEQSATGVKDVKSRIISDVVLAITVVITVAAMWYILRQMNAVKPSVIYARRKTRQAKLARAGFSPYGNGLSSSSSDVFNPNISDSDIPLTKTHHQQWDNSGKAVGYVPGPSFIFTPKPRIQQAPRDLEAGLTRPFARRERGDSSDLVGWDTSNKGPLVRTTPPSPPPGPPNTSSRSPGQQDSRNVPQTQPSPFAHSEPHLNGPFFGHGEESRFVSQQTPTQTTFPTRHDSDEGQGYPMARYNAIDRHGSDSSEEAYTRYEHGQGHVIEPTDATFRTAYTSSPPQDDDLTSSGHQHYAQRSHSPGSYDLR
ncbi:hypothetical protein CPB83DRAFT_861653 [Crepidotus variabilis]|uniref:Golgi apparatus membrane protein TVP38 n=1 Tax=Crepidotus variabilis TaxID=179855 RepID=A0A9P6E824_9AGAR|nr:hypothetical protein CPB83DRAFT_861653 [Crepidotus variabilis]